MMKSNIQPSTQVAYLSGNLQQHQEIMSCYYSIHRNVETPNTFGPLIAKNQHIVSLHQTYSTYMSPYTKQIP